MKSLQGRCTVCTAGMLGQVGDLSHARQASKQPRLLLLAGCCWYTPCKSDSLLQQSWLGYHECLMGNASQPRALASCVPPHALKMQ